MCPESIFLLESVLTSLESGLSYWMDERIPMPTQVRGHRGNEHLSPPAFCREICELCRVGGRGASQDSSVQPVTGSHFPQLKSAANEAGKRVGSELLAPLVGFRSGVAVTPWFLCC